jgi:IclR family acetate operon transcriptional repressor
MERQVIRRKGTKSEHDPDARDGGVQSVDRALQIIETLAEDDEGYRLSDLAVRTGLSTSTAHRLLTTLEKRRFVQFDRTESKWHVGAKSFAVGATFTRRRNFVALAMPYLRKLRDVTRETANLAVVDDASIIVLTRVESREIMRSLTKVGGRVAMVASGVGKVVRLMPTRTSTPSSAVTACRASPRSRSYAPATCSASSRPSAPKAMPSMTRKRGWACAALRRWCSTTVASRRPRSPSPV